MVIQKENLLIISPTLPNPKMSAGDYRVYTLVKELKKYFNIFFIPLNYIKPTKQNIKITDNIIKPINSTKKFQKFLKEKNISVCIFEKYFNMPFELCKFMPLVKIPIIDTHEIGFLKSQALSKIQKITNNLKLFKAKELLFYKNAKILIAITKKEKKILQEYFPDKKIIVIPTCTTISKIKKHFNERKNICYFGFYGHQPNIDAVKYFIKNIFNKINIPNIKFYVLGYGSNQIKKTNNVVCVENIKNISKELSKYKVFVCPLRYGAGLKKKVLDAMASHTPVVSTSFGVEGIKNIDTKYFDINSKEFINKIIKLYTDENLWQKESKYNFNIAKKYYSLTSFKEYVKMVVKIIKKQKF